MFHYDLEFRLRQLESIGGEAAWFGVDGGADVSCRCGVVHHALLNSANSWWYVDSPSTVFIEPTSVVAVYDLTWTAGWSYPGVVCFAGRRVTRSAQEIDANDGRFYVGYYKSPPEISTQGQIEGQGDGPICRDVGSVRREQCVFALYCGPTYFVAWIDARVRRVYGRLDPFPCFHLHGDRHFNARSQYLEW